jgi:hypothetical protein
MEKKKLSIKNKKKINLNFYQVLIFYLFFYDLKNKRWFFVLIRVLSIETQNLNKQQNNPVFFLFAFLLAN